MPEKFCSALVFARIDPGPTDRWGAPATRIRHSPRAVPSAATSEGRVKARHSASETAPSLRIPKQSKSTSSPLFQSRRSAHSRPTGAYESQTNRHTEHTRGGGADSSVTLLRNWHVVVPEDLPLFSVERRGTTHERKRIMLICSSDVKFKLFIVCI